MNHLIKNFSPLATTPLRHDALTIVESGLTAIDTKQALTKAVVIKNGVATVGDRSYQLSKYQHIYVVGFGKVSCAAAQALETIFKGKVQDGAVVGLKERVCASVATYAGTHPLPTGINYVATKHIEEVARKATADDLVFVVVSGGGSALLCSSMSECDQGSKLFSAFLQSGGTIEELNIVRKHLSHLKGGGLAKTLYPATVVGLIFSDVPGGDLGAVASGPTYKDETTAADAQAIIDRYQLGEYYLQETPKDKRYFEKVHNVPVVTNRTALQAMSNTAQRLGYQATVLSDDRYYTPESLQSTLAGCAQSGAYLVGGETKLTIPSDCKGKGGRNDYLALSMFDQLADDEVFVSVASDGHDNTSAAGALMDGELMEKAKARGVDPLDYFECHNSYPFFDLLGAHLQTGPLESNVSDLQLLLKAKVVPAAVGIEAVSAQVIKDSRGSETIEVSVSAGGKTGSFSVPGGASTGATEVAVLAPATALRQLQKIVIPKILGQNIFDQEGLDTLLHEVDGTPNFSKIGGNLALGISVATLKVAAAVSEIATHEYVAQLFNYREQASTPRLFVNLINGGKHATAGSAIQEHQIIPETESVEQALRVVADIQRALHEILVAKYTKAAIGTGDEGGFEIPDTDPVVAFEHLQSAIAAVQPPVPVAIGADMAASSFCESKHYVLAGTKYTTDDLLQFYTSLHQSIPALQMVEDPFTESDQPAFVRYQKAHPGILVIGDDLTTTNQKLVREAVAAGAITGLIVKPNQIGTVSDTLRTMSLAYKHQVKCIVSHRSGETMDDFIADLAYGTKCFGLKAGAPTAPARKVKYDRLLEITT